MSGDDSASSSGSSGEGEWLDVEQDAVETDTAVISLLDDRVFPDAMSMLTYCREKHQLDFLAIRDRLGLDFVCGLHPSQGLAPGRRRLVGEKETNIRLLPATAWDR